ncbi:MAG TPA: hypothetical protein PK873_05890, partial [Pseudomonas sp.]|uniref:hypothetical protein n=1 Tax=Pseudomonas sp. TaxID=306 RepID=UPI002CB1C151
LLPENKPVRQDGVYGALTNIIQGATSAPQDELGAAIPINSIANTAPQTAKRRHWGRRFFTTAA